MRKRSGTWKERVLLALAPRAISVWLQLLRWTVRTEFVGADELFRRWREGEQTVVAFWHNRLVMMPVAYRGRGICILNSESRDGEIATRAVARWGVHVARGSATRGGAKGFLALVRAFRRGSDLALVPDGPRGPKCIAKAGVVHLGRAVGAPIVPVSYAASRFRRLRSWDRMIVPLPFSRVCFAVGEPVVIDRDADDAAVERARSLLEARLNAVTTTAEEHIGVRTDD